MSNITNLSQYKEKQNAPDEDQVFVDDDGVQWLKYTFSYKDQRNKTMCFNLWATSISDAEERLASLKDNAKLDGQVISEVN